MANVILEMKNIVKEFPGVRALDNVTFKVTEGSIHALVGENGAGKSTLMNVLSGIYPYGSYSGDIIYNGEICRFNNITDSEAKGIVIIHQELALIPYMTIAENMFLGAEKGSKFKIDWDEENKIAKEYIEKVGLDENINALIKDVGLGKQQLVEIAKALSKHAKLLILDEPTSSLSESDSRHLLDLLLELKKEGLTSIIISHKLNEVEYVADDITVVRDGRTVETLKKGVDDISEARIIKGMVGRELTNRFPERPNCVKDEISFEVKNWSVYHPINDDKRIVKDASLYIKKGEVVGLCGLVGSGRSKLAMSVFGKSFGKKITGEVLINGKHIKNESPKDAINSGLAYVTEDRKGKGLILSNLISVNTTLANLRELSSKLARINEDKELEVTKDYIKQLKTKCTGPEQEVGNLSGGNQQKVLLAKWMFAKPEVLILDEPTRGIDVGAKYEIYCIINSLVEAGKSVLMISSELPEVLGMSDRIYIMDNGRVVGEKNAKDATQENIMQCIMDSRKKEK